MDEHRLSGVAIAVGALIGGLGVMVPVAFFAGLYFGTLRAPKAPPPPAPTCVCQTTYSDKVKLSFRSEPSGAEVRFANGMMPGRTPLEVSVSMSEPMFDVQVVLVGYRSEVLTINPDRNRDFLVALSPDSKKHHADGCDDSDIKFLAPRF
jgi:PEGA domain